MWLQGVATDNPLVPCRLDGQTVKEAEENTSNFLPVVLPLVGAALIKTTSSSNLDVWEGL